VDSDNFQRLEDPCPDCGGRLYLRTYNEGVNMVSLSCISCKRVWTGCDRSEVLEKVRNSGQLGYECVQKSTKPCLTNHLSLNNYENIFI
jgi:ssDNA-binding Zn-finger/Zn-ribbon topoisomerase 1